MYSALKREKWKLLMRGWGERQSSRTVLVTQWLLQDFAIVLYIPSSPWLSELRIDPRQDSFHLLNSGWQENSCFTRNSQFIVIVQNGTIGMDGFNLDDPCWKKEATMFSWILFKNLLYYCQYRSCVLIALTCLNVHHFPERKKELLQNLPQNSTDARFYRPNISISRYLPCWLPTWL